VVVAPVLSETVTALRGAFVPASVTLPEI